MALRGGWYLSTNADGRVRKDSPHKPNHPHEDFGDAFCYAIAGVAPMVPERDPKRTRPPSRVSFNPYTILEPRGARR